MAGVAVSAQPSPGALTKVPSDGAALSWLAAGAVSLVAVIAAVASGEGRLFWAAAVCTAIATTFAVRPEVGLFFFVLARPVLDVWADRPLATIGGLQLNAASLMALMLIAVGGAYIVERWAVCQRAPALRPFLVFAGLAAVGIPFAPAPAAALTEWLRFFSLFVLYAVAFTVVARHGRFGRLAGVVLAAAAVPLIVAVWQTAHGGSREIADFGRATGTFLHPDPFGIFVAVVLVFAVPILLSGGRGWRGALLLALPVALVALVGSYTRTGWLALPIGLLVAAAVRNRSLFLLTPLLVVAVAVAAPSTTTRFNDLSNSRTSFGGPGNSLRARYDLWRTNVPKIKQNPVAGTGLKGIAEEEGAFVHSDYVRAAVETGIPGFLAYVWLLIAAVRGCSRGVRRSRSHGGLAHAVATGAFATSVVFLVVSADSNLMTQVAVAGTFWAIVAAGHAVGDLAARGGADETAPAR